MSHFPNVPVIQFEGPKSKNPFAFKHYNPDEKIGGKKMKDHMRFAAAYWHVMRNSLSDPFGVGTALMPWDDGSDSSTTPSAACRCFFEFLEKCRDRLLLLPRPRHRPGRQDPRRDARQTSTRVAKELKRLPEGHRQEAPLGNGLPLPPPAATRRAPATSPNADAFAYGAGAGHVTRSSATKALGGEGYVFWGGREGYATLLNTDMKRELDHLAALPAHGRRLQEEDRLQGPVLHRAQARRSRPSTSTTTDAAAVPQLPRANTACWSTSS
jgi:xylose isomerase